MDEKIKQTTQPSPPEAEKTVTPEVKSEIKSEELVNNDPERGKADPLLDGYYRTNPFFFEVASYFNVEQKDFDVAAPKLGVIVDWVREKFGITKPEDILLKIRASEDMVQRPGWDEKRYTNLYKYVYLDNQARAIEKAKKAFERNPNGKSN